MDKSIHVDKSDVNGLTRKT